MESTVINAEVWQNANTPTPLKLSTVETLPGVIPNQPPSQTPVASRSPSICLMMLCEHRGAVYLITTVGHLDGLSITHGNPEGPRIKTEDSECVQRHTEHTFTVTKKLGALKDIKKRTITITPTDWHQPVEWCFLGATQARVLELNKGEAVHIRFTSSIPVPSSQRIGSVGLADHFAQPSMQRTS